MPRLPPVTSATRPTSTSAHDLLLPRATLVPGRRIRTHATPPRLIGSSGDDHTPVASTTRSSRCPCRRWPTPRSSAPATWASSTPTSASSASRGQSLRLRDGRLEGANDGEDVGLGVRVVHDGAWGFAAAGELTPEAAARAAEQAVAPGPGEPPAVHRARRARAGAGAPGRGPRVRLRRRPVRRPDAEKVALLADWSHRLLGRDGVAHVDASVYAVKENKYYADLAGTSTTQQRVRLNPELTAVAVDKESGAFETMGTVAPPVGRGWEYLTGHRLGLGHRARGAARAAAREARAPRASSRAPTTWSSTRRTCG